MGCNRHIVVVIKQGVFMSWLLLLITIGVGVVYPPAFPGHVVDDYSGTPVPDPYRWLESVDSVETVEWVQAQGELWATYISSVPVLETIRGRLDEIYDYFYLSMPYRSGQRYFFYVNEGLQEHSVFCMADSIGGERTILVDPNEFSDDRRSFSGSVVTNDGTLMAWLTSTAGSDWKTIYFTDLETGEVLSDTLSWLKGGVCWNGYGLYKTGRAGSRRYGAFARWSNCNL